jgi:P-type Mg2+ transporter
MEQTSLQDFFTELSSSKAGLTSQEAKVRLEKYGPNSLKPQQRGKGITLFLSQFKSPLILLLIGAAILSFSLGGHSDSTIIFAIVVLSGLLSFF